MSDKSQLEWHCAAAVKYGMDITHILLHNDEPGKISKEQKAGEWPVWRSCQVSRRSESCNAKSTGF